MVDTRFSVLFVSRAASHLSSHYTRVQGPCQIQLCIHLLKELVCGSKPNFVFTLSIDSDDDFQIIELLYLQAEVQVLLCPFRTVIVFI